MLCSFGWTGLKPSSSSSQHHSGSLCTCWPKNMEPSTCLYWLHHMFHWFSWCCTNLVWISKKAFVSLKWRLKLYISNKTNSVNISSLVSLQIYSPILYFFYFLSWAISESDLGFSLFLCFLPLDPHAEQCASGWGSSPAPPRTAPRSPAQPRTAPVLQRSGTSLVWCPSVKRVYLRINFHGVNQMRAPRCM